MQPSLWTSLFITIPAVRQAEELAAAGFPCAEISCEAISDPETGQLSRRHAEALRDAYARAGVRPLQVHYPIVSLNPDAPRGPGAPHSERVANFAHPDEARREFELRCAEELLGLCPVIGIRVMVVHPGGGRAEDEAAQAHTLAAMRRLAPTAESCGVTIAVENMARSGDGLAYGADPEQLIRLCEEVGSPNVGICLDTSHANLAGLDIPAAVRRVGPRLAATHISDNFGQRDDHLFPYGGRIAWEPIVSALYGIGYAGLFNLEIPGENRCPLDVIRLKARYARELLEVMLRR